MKITVKVLSLILALVLALGLVACGETGDSSVTTTTPANNENPTPDKNLDVNVTVLSGTTGMGIAKLMSDSKNGKAALKYNFTVISDATQTAMAFG